MTCVGGRISRPAATPALPEDIGNFAPWFEEALAQGRKKR